MIPIGTARPRVRGRLVVFEFEVGSVGEEVVFVVFIGIG